MDILILGGTGAIGNHLIATLAKAGHNIDVTSRKKHENEESIRYFQGDAHDVEFIKDILRNKHYAAIFDFMIYTTSEFRERYRMFLDNTEQYFFLSTSRVYADVAIIQETTPRLLDTVNDIEYLNTDEYAIAKARQENILNQSERRNYTIIRPYITYSRYRLQLGVLDKDTFVQRALNGQSIVVPRDIMQHTTTLTYGADVASCMARLIGNSKAMGNTFHITTNKAIKWMDVLEIYISAFEKKKGFRPKVKIISHCPQLYTETERYQVIYDRLYNRCFDNSKIMEAIGGFEFTDPRKGLASCMDAFLETPQFSGLDSRSEGIHDHYSREYTSLAKFPTIKQKIRYLLYRTAPVIIARSVLFIKHLRREFRKKGGRQ